MLEVIQAQKNYSSSSYNQSQMTLSNCTFMDEVASFQETYSIGRWVSKYEKSIFVPLQQEVSNIRIDLGSEADTYFKVRSINTNVSVIKYLLGVLESVSFVRIMIFSAIIFLAISAVIYKWSVVESIYKWRWVIGAFVILFCTVFELHASSLSTYNVYLPGYDYNPLFGVSRAIRSDEYSVFTSMAFSQVAEGFPWFNDFYRGCLTDMAMIYGQPIKIFIMLFRPFQIGYLLFGAEKGLAFYWSSRLVICLLISIEFGKLITKKDIYLSMVYGILVAFSPVVQWWFSVNGLVEMLIFGQGALLLLNYYFETDIIKKKIGYVFGLVVCAGGYILCLYPAWQIPFFYVFLAYAIILIMEKYKSIRIEKHDILMIASGIVVLVISMVFILLQSQDTIKDVMSTVYPGERSVLGGSLNEFPSLFRSWGNIFLPLIGRGFKQINVRQLIFLISFQWD